MSLTNSPFWFSSGATSAGGGGTVVYPFSIDQSLRLDGTSAYLTKNNFGTATDTAKRTFSTWVKRGDTEGVAAYNHIISAGSSAIDGFGFQNGTAKLQWLQGGLVTKDGVRDLRDTSAWYHFFTTWNATDNELYIYVNGELDYFSTASISALSKLGNTGHTTYIGRRSNVATYIHGYLAETVFLDGYIGDVNDFGELVNGIWVPKNISTASLTYGTNGFYLDYADSSDLGKDVSGQNNHFTSNGLAAEDQVPDSPTNNFATWNVTGVQYGGTNAPTVSEGSLKAATSGNPTHIYGTFAIQPTDTQGYYWEVKATSLDAARSYLGIVAPEGGANGASIGSYEFYYKFVLNMNGNFYGNNDVSSTNVVALTSWTTNDILMFAYKEGKIWIGKNGTWMNSGDPAAGTGDLVAQDGGRPSDRGDVTWYPYAGYNSTYTANFGQEGTFAGTETAGGNSDANGYGDFKYSVPSGFLAMCSANLPAPAIGPQLASGQQSDDYFEPILYTGNGAVQHIGSGGAQHPIDTTTIANSIRFNDNDSAYLSRTPASAGNRKTFTLSTWIKPNSAATNYPPIFNAGTSAPDSVIRLGTTNDLQVVLENGGGSNSLLITNRTLKDSSKWYHILVAVDTTNATADDRIKIYIDGVEETSFSSRTNPSLNFDTNINNTVVHKISAQRYASYWDGYMAEMYFIDGTALDPTSFGQYGSNGYWIPKAVSGLTFGTNGFYLDFSDNSTANALGTDSSGNGNDFSATNVATTDQMGDSPTQNFNTFNPNNCYSSGSRLSEGNLKYAHDGVNGHHTTTLAFNSSGNWYWEVGLTNSPSVWLGIVDANQNCTGSGSINGYFWYPGNGYKSQNPYGSPTSYAWSTTATTGDIIGFQIKNEVMTIYKNGVSLGSPWTIAPGYYRPFAMSPGATSGISIFNFGADDSFAGNETGGAGATDANGYGSFYYTPPTDALAIVDDNIPVEGITGPDLVWIKERNGTANHYLFDTIRGATKNLHSNTTDAEATDVNSLTSFDYQGFTIGSDAEINTASNTYVSWNWKAGGKANTFNVDGTGYASMTAAGLTDGDIALTGLSVNTTAGFSIGTYTGIGAAGPSTIAHGLGKQVQLVMVKGINNSNYSFAVYTRAGDADGSTFLNTGGQVGGNPPATSGLFTQDAFGSGSGTFNDSFFSIGGPNNYTSQTYNYVFYAFANIEGYLKHGSYEGNGDPDGTFVYTGFRPAWVMAKRTNSTGAWLIYDNKRNTYNLAGTLLEANTSDFDETNATGIDFLSNGIKMRNTFVGMNASGGSYIYLAFAEQPFKYANAR